MTERAERTTMNAKLLEKLRRITDEEQALLAGDGTVERARYTSRREFVVDSAKRCATSPAGGGKRTCVNLCEVCGKAKLKKLRLTTKFSFAHGRTLGSPSGRAGETPARAARLRGEPPTRVGLRS